MQSLRKNNGIELYCVTVGLCDGKWESKNADIIRFNALLEQKKSDKVKLIDAYDYIRAGLESINN